MTVFALFFVDYQSYSMGVIVRVLVVTLAIGVNEEIVTRGILLVGLRNGGVSEWLVWLITSVVFALLHAVNLLGGGNFTVFLVTLATGTLLYVSRRVFNNLFVPILLHAVYDTAFFLLPGAYTLQAGLPDQVLDIQLGSFLVLLVATIVFAIFGRGLLNNDAVRWG